MYVGSCLTSRPVELYVISYMFAVMQVSNDSARPREPISYFHYAVGLKLNGISIDLGLYT